MVRFLLEREANVNCTDDKAGICSMSAFRFPKICKYLLDAGAKVNEITNFRESALMTAIDNWQNKTIALLLGAGADPMYTNNIGRNALYLAAFKDIKLHSDYQIKNRSLVTNSIVKALEIASCQLIIDGGRDMALRFRQNALKLRKLSSKTHIHISIKVHSTSKLDPILSLFDSEVSQALIFI